MYGETQVPSVVPPVVAGSAVVLLPQTGSDFLTTTALAVAAGLFTWAVVYFYKLKVARR